MKRKERTNGNGWMDRDDVNHVLPNGMDEQVNMCVNPHIGMDSGNRSLAVVNVGMNHMGKRTAQEPRNESSTPKTQ
jgi:hypothetical protein